jgi:hypothetical protein
LQKAIEIDHTHGISKRFHGVLNSALGTAQAADQRFGVTQRAAAVDEKYSIQEKAKSGMSGFMRYFETALDTPTGKRVRTFYDDRRKEVLEIHNEARRYITLSFVVVGGIEVNGPRLADERKRMSPSAASPSYASATTGLGSTAPTSEMPVPMGP